MPMTPRDIRRQHTGRDAVAAVSFYGDQPTVGDVLRQSKALLLRQSTATPVGEGGAGVRERGLEAEVLLAHILGIGRAALLAGPDRPLSPGEARHYEILVRRRISGEPVAYLTGHREFFGLDFTVDRRVLVPRPETELLVEQAIAEAQRLQPRIGAKNPPHGGALAPTGQIPTQAALAVPELRIADVGTGSGAIAISLAKHLSGAKLYAIDLSPAALAVAAANCLRHGVVGQVTLLHGDLLSPLPGAVDIIIANLPYVAPEDLAGLRPEVAQYEPRLALLADESGLALNRRLLAQAHRYLPPGGAVILEIAPSQAPAIVAQAQSCFPRATVIVGKDYAGLDRVVLVRTAREH